MLQFVSFFVVLAMLSGTIRLIVMTIRNASGAIGSALLGNPTNSVTFVTLRPRALRQAVVIPSGSALLRAAA